VYRRVILRDFGKNIYKVSLRVAMLAALKGNITGKRRMQRLTYLGLIMSEYKLLYE
jgi:hypothetical protein